MFRALCDFVIAVGWMSLVLVGLVSVVVSLALSTSYSVWFVVTLPITLVLLLKAAFAAMEYYD